jgi:hypothetical protein
VELDYILYRSDATERDLDATFLIRTFNHSKMADVDEVAEVDALKAGGYFFQELLFKSRKTESWPIRIETSS